MKGRRGSTGYVLLICKISQEWGIQLPWLRLLPWEYQCYLRSDTLLEQLEAKVACHQVEAEPWDLAPFEYLGYTSQPRHSPASGLHLLGFWHWMRMSTSGWMSLQWQSLQIHQKSFVPQFSQCSWPMVVSRDWIRGCPSDDFALVEALSSPKGQPLQMLPLCCSATSVSHSQ